MVHGPVRPALRCTQYRNMPLREPQLTVIAFLPEGLAPTLEGAGGLGSDGVGVAVGGLGVGVAVGGLGVGVAVGGLGVGVAVGGLGVGVAVEGTGV